MNHCGSTSFFGIFLYILFLTSYFSSYFFLLQFDLILVACRLQTSHKLMIHDNQVTCLHKFQVMIMHGQGAEHACSQPCDGSMCSSIDESFQFNVSLQHVIVYIVLIVNIFSISSYFLLQFKRKCIPIVGYGLDCSNGNKPFLFNSFLEEHLIVIAIIIKQEYNCVLVYLECLRTKFIALGQENQRLLKDLQVNVKLNNMINLEVMCFFKFYFLHIVRHLYLMINNIGWPLPTQQSQIKCWPNTLVFPHSPWCVIC